MSDLLNSITSDGEMNIMPNMGNFNFLNNSDSMSIDEPLNTNLLPQAPPMQKVQLQQPQLQAPPVQKVQVTQEQNLPKSILKQDQNVTFNNVVETKDITPDNVQDNKILENNLVENLTEIKKMKIGKLLVPSVTVYFTIALIVISIILFFMTKPKKHSKKNVEDD